MDLFSSSNEKKGRQEFTMFSGELFDRLINDDLTKNILISPYSIAVALSILVPGASGTTKKEILHSIGLTEEELHSTHKEIRNRYLHENQKSLTLANSLWLTKELSFSEDFQQVIKKHYDAHVSELDTAEVINSWIKDKTNNKITAILDHVQSDLVLLVLSAVYYSGTWMEPFDEDLTSDGYFDISSNGSTNRKSVPFMMRQGEYYYEETDNCQTIKLPYKDNTFSMEICLPKTAEGVKDTRNKMISSDCSWINNKRVKKGLIKIPRFSLESDLSLNDVLNKIGINEGFDPQKANFSKMITEPKEQLVIDEVKQKTFIEVNENGTEAAAATSITVRDKSIEDEFIMEVNQPFFVQILDEELKLVLFIGYVADPT
ncbi:serpin family protein [Evansella sp. AB-rgal1]|uniref:serpin family protein n=1 Tax=Evansella sp. AB-rgal1 TaxID=3242696 RepID=UPI00359E1D49